MSQEPNISIKERPNINEAFNNDDYRKIQEDMR